MDLHEGNGHSDNGKFVFGDTPTRQAVRARIGALVAEYRPFLQYAAARRVSWRFDLGLPIQRGTGDA